MEANELQQQLFSYLKENIPPHLSLVDGLCELLNLSHDSVYRRIRGEKPISLSELKTICEHYHLSVDQLLQLQNESVLFQAPGMNRATSSLPDYLKGMLNQFRYFNSFKTTEMKYLCKDVTFWYFFLFPEICAFKSFFWSRTIMSSPELSAKKFSFADFSFNECFQMGQQILKEYNNIPSEELWNVESINSTINQICYYLDAGVFASHKEAETVINSFHLMIDHLQMQAEKGVKFMPGANEVSYKTPVKFYVNELILGNNTILLTLDNQRISMVTYSVLSYLITRDNRFADKAFNSFNSLLSRSSLISNAGEKERNRFFNTLHDKVHAIK